MNIPVILGSVRTGRRSLAPARLFTESIRAKGHQSELVDFLRIPLPFYDASQVPVQMKGVYPNANVQLWSDIAYAADGFILVTPEYNHGYPAVLKNALDWLYLEFDHKPVGLVGVSNGSLGGSRAVEQLRPIVENFSMFAVRETVLFANVQNLFDQEGRLLDQGYLAKIDGLLDSLLAVARIMSSYPRAERPRP